MFRFFQSCFTVCVRIILSLRYRVRVSGLEKLEARDGVLILPNHPGEIDPAIVISQLWRYRPHPVVVEDFFYMAELKLLMRLVGAIPMPNTATSMGSYKRMRIQRALDNVVGLLDAGESVIMYPAGRLMRGNREELRGASGLYDLLQRNPDMKIVLVRTTGLVGSCFSWITHQERPDLGKCIRYGFGHLLKNLMFFTPRREIHIEVTDGPADFPRHADKMTINTWLENWYNAHNEEISLVSYSRWGEVLFDVEAAQKPVDLPAIAEVPDAIRSKVCNYLAATAGHSPEDVHDNHSLANDLGLDSLMMADLLAWLDEEFLVSDVELTDIGTVGEVLLAANGVVQADEHHDVEPPPGWIESTPRPELVAPRLNTPIHHQFLETCDRLKRRVALADETGGVLTYGRMKIGALLLADIIAEYPEKNIGIMLPASSGANLLVVATLLAGKVPVMINWTLGDANLEHTIKSSELSRILTSGRFLDKLQQLNFDLLGDHLITLEDLRSTKITMGRKIRATINATRSAARLSRRYGPQTSVDDTAVILFTSGSEAAPKGVPLSHRNVLANIAACVEAAKLDNSDVLYGFLPPFHSFGFTVTGLLPLLAGMKTAYYPNPTESRRLVRGIRMWQPTMVCGTPTFISAICKAAGDDRLESVDKVVVGAEKAADELFDTVADTFGATLQEGYGITECSPVLTLTARAGPRVGVGRPVGDVKIAIVDPETHEPMALTDRGLILVRGSNVFGGYLGRESSEAFSMVDGERFYITGDLGFLDADGNLSLSGRLKRFVKVGGEMLSLPAMEEAIKTSHPDDEEGMSQAAVVSYETDGERPRIAAFTVFEASTSEINALLKAAGFGNIARVQHAVQVTEIPLLGTGKTDYRSMQDQLRGLVEAEQP